MIYLLGCILAGIGLWWSTQRFVNSSELLAAHLGLNATAGGAILIAVLTSMPELVVSIQATHLGHFDMALGNILGSVWANTCLILGVLSIIRPVRIKLSTLNFDQSIHLVLILLILWGYYLSVPIWLLSLLMFLVYVVYILYIVQGPVQPVAINQPMKQNYWHESIKTLFWGVVLLLTSYLLVTCAAAMAKIMSMSPYWIGLTVVAIGTSLPELSAAMVSHQKKQDDWVLGNALGSNVFLLSVVLPIILCMDITGLTDGMLTSIAVMGWMLIATFLMLRYFDRSEYQLNRFEGMILVGIYIVYLVFSA